MKDSHSLSVQTPAPQKANKYRVFVAADEESKAAQSPLSYRPTVAAHRRNAVRKAKPKPAVEPPPESARKASLFAFAGKLPGIMKQQGARNVQFFAVRRVPGSANSSPGIATHEGYRRTRNFATTTPHKGGVGLLLWSSSGIDDEAARNVILRKSQEELNRDFSPTEGKEGAKACRLSLPRDEAMARIVHLFIAAAAAGRADRLEQYLSINCSTALDRKYLVNSEDEFGRSSIFYAVYNRNIVVFDEKLK